MKLLEKITIPSTVQQIGDKAFQNCSSLDNVVLPDGLKEINKNDIDILGIKDKYYKKAKHTDIANENITIEVDFRINKKGLIYEVEK